MDILSTARRCALASLALLSLALFNNLKAAAYATEPDWEAGGRIHINHSIQSNRGIDLQAPLTLDIDGGHTVSLDGPVSSLFPPYLEGLIKDGEGRLELRGENTELRNHVRLQAGTLHVAGRYPLGYDTWAQLRAYRGTTLSYEAGAIVGATLALDNASAPGQGSDATAIRWRVDQGTATQLGPIVGVTPLIKTGAGTLRLLDGNHSSGSRLTIAQGAVQLNSLFAGQLDVHNAAVLTGDGEAGALTVAAGGIVAPTGRLGVDRTLQFLPDSQLHIRAWGDGRHDSIAVIDGHAKLDGHVIVLPQGGPADWQEPVEGIIVHAKGGLNGSRFATVTSALPYLEPALSYDANAVTLSLRPRPALPTQPQGVASGWPATLRNMLADDSRFVREAIYARAGAGNHEARNKHHRATPGLAKHPFSQYHHIWAQAFHSSNSHRDARVEGTLQRRVSGILIGVEREINDHWRMGIYGGGSRTQANLRSLDARPNAGPDAHDANRAGTRRPGAMPARPSANVESAHLGLYAHHDTSWGSQLSLGLAHSRHQLRSRRSAITPALRDHLSSRYHARTSQLFAQLQHPVWTSRDGNTRVTPFARTAWVHSRQDAHSERGGPLALRLASESTTVWFNTLGIRAERRLALPQGDATVSGSLAWRHAGGDTRSAISQRFRDDVLQSHLSASGIAVIRQAWQLQLSMEGELSKRAQLGLHYGGQYGKRLQDHGVRVGMVVRW